MRNKYPNLIRLLVVLAMVVTLVGAVVAPSSADVSGVVVTATPNTAGSSARYEISFTTTAALTAGDTVNVAFPSAVTLPTSMSNSAITLTSGGVPVDYDLAGSDITINATSKVVTIEIPAGETLGAGACKLVFKQAAGIKNPTIARKGVAPLGYKFTVTTSAEMGGTTNTAYLDIVPTYSISPSAAPRWTPITVTGAGWTPNTWVKIGTVGLGGLSGEGVVNADGTFSASALPVGTGQVTCTDGSGNDDAYWGIARPSFTLLPKLEVTPTSGGLGTTVTVKGVDFSGGGTIPAGQLTLGGVGLNAAAITFQNLDAYGNLDDFSFTATIPATAVAGANQVKAIDSSGNPLMAATATFTIAGASVAFNPGSGKAGDLITLTGTSWKPGDEIAAGGILIGGLLGDPWNPNKIVIDANGGWSAVLEIPGGLLEGANVVRIVSVQGTAVNTTIAISARSLGLSPTSGPKGTKVTVTGSGMTENGKILIGDLDFGSINWNTADIAIDSQGNIFPTTQTVPAAAAVGQQIVVALDDGGAASRGMFTITQPVISINPTSGYQNETITVTGTGWLAGSFVTVTFNGQDVALSIPDANGNFNAQVAVPVGVPDTAIIDAHDGSKGNNAADKIFTLKKAVATLEPASGVAGDTITISGSGFPPQDFVKIGFDIDPQPVTPMVLSDEFGTFTADILVPGRAVGTHAVKVQVGNSPIITLIYTIEKAAVSVGTQLKGISDVLVRVWGYDAATGQWSLYDPADPAGSDIDSLLAGMGYWVSVSADAQLIYGGNTYNLVEGWNLIGWR